jgi:hypothetical protein
VTYPGPWIRQVEVWNEVARVLRDSGVFVILIGGTVSRGRWARIRSLLSRVAYGANPQHFEFQPPCPAQSVLDGTTEVVEDEWGTAYYWRGRRLSRSGTVVESTKVG